ncbi:MAG: hypothetical protein QGD94_09925, partial [Planctomycetia bacterium]|nr:hypothetical protein [Planctomycetia bacterium]
MNDKLFAYIDIQEFENGQSIHGAALVTDAATDPVEFRCTSAIRPTLLQKTLWGKRLAEHIASHLVARPLLHALSNPVALIIVRKPEFVELRAFVETPLVQLLRNEELAKALRVTSTDGDDDMLESAGGQFEPIVLKTHREHRDDLKVAREMLTETFRLQNVLEPFERAKNALEMIHQQ